MVPCAVLLAILSQNILYHNVFSPLSLAPLFQHPRAFSPATTMSFILRYDTGPERLNTSACWQALLRHLCQDSRIGSALGTSSLPQHINNIDPHIKITIETEVNDKLPSLDLCVYVKDDGGTKITIYRKPVPHTDQYLNFTSHHHTLVHQRSIRGSYSN